jgi:replicative DNA helicase
MCQDNSVKLRALSELSDEHFYWPAHAIVYRALGRLNTVTFQSLCIEIGPELPEVGDKEGLNDIWSFVPGGSNYEYYRDQLITEYQCRQILIISADINRFAREGNREAAQEAAGRIAGIRRRSEHAVGSKSIATELVEVFERREAGIDERIDMFIPGLADYIDAIRPGNLLVVGGKPGGCKTAFACTWAKKVLLESKPLLFISMEMTRTEIAERIISQWSRVPLLGIKRGILSNEQWIELGNKVAAFAKLPFHCVDDNTLSIQQLRSITRTLHMNEGLRMVIVDYVQLVKTSGKAKEMRHQIAEVSHNLKDMAKELSVPVLALSQMNNQGDTFESKSLEQDADVYMSLLPVEGDDYRKDCYIRKNRHGIGGATVQLNWNGPYCEIS